MELKLLGTDTGYRSYSSLHENKDLNSSDFLKKVNPISQKKLEFVNHSHQYPVHHHLYYKPRLLSNFQHRFHIPEKIFLIHNFIENQLKLLRRKKI